MSQTQRRFIEDIRPAPRAPVRHAVRPLPVRATPQPVALKQPPQEPHPQWAAAALNEPSDAMTVVEHLTELRGRLMRSLLFLLAGGAIGYAQRDIIIDVLVRPLNQKLYYTSPTGGFDFLIKICIFFGFLLAVPIIIFNLIKFIAPALPSRITYKTSKLMATSILLALAGVCFAYFVSLPAALHFLNNFNNGEVNSLINANEYFNFVMIYLAGFALLFQMPLILYFVNKITPLTPRALMKKQRMVILVSFIVAAILTPTPDPVNQTLMAAPIVALYQSSIGVVWHTNRRRTRRAKRAQTSAATPALA